VPAVDPIHETVNAVYVAESRRVLATLIRLLGDFEAAEEALHDAFRAALEQWPRDGVPANPRAWLVSAGRFKAIDAMRRRSRFDQLDESGPVAVGRRGKRRGRPAEADLHLLSPGARP
jgi:RNA polymerase sigma-70 factor (ECF subfamily)